MARKKQKARKVFISVDMEGICGVSRWEDVSEKGSDYAYFRSLMTEEANAAVQGAVDAGATQIIVRDAHGHACNLLPEKLHEKALLIRGWSGGPLLMMEGIDRSFDAAVFIGYHSAAGTADGVLHHTITRRLAEVRLNGRAVPEITLNAAIAGQFGVPVVFASGDRALIQQAKELLGSREYVIVKEGIGQAARNIHPAVARKLIRQGVKRALSEFQNYPPFLPEKPIRLTLQFVEVKDAARAALFPGVQELDSRTVELTDGDLMTVLKFFYLAVS